METLLINEQFVSQFKYWRAGQICTGMSFRNNLFEHVSQFKQNQRPQAFELAWQLSQAGREAIVTASASQYTVWANLRSGGSISHSQENSPQTQIEPLAQGSRLKLPLSA